MTITCSLAKSTSSPGMYTHSSFPFWNNKVLMTRLSLVSDLFRFNNQQNICPFRVSIQLNQLRGLVEDGKSCSQRKKKSLL